MESTADNYTMKSLGRDLPLYHLLFSAAGARRSGQTQHIEYLTEDGRTLQVSEAVKVSDANVGEEAVRALLEDYKSRFPDGTYLGRGVWSSSTEIGRY